MTQGLFINNRRPASKKEVRDLLDQAYLDGDVDETQTLSKIWIEATSIFGNEFDGSLSDNDIQNPITFVGPDPHSDRRFFGRITYNQKKERWIVQ